MFFSFLPTFLALARIDRVAVSICSHIRKSRDFTKKKKENQEIYFHILYLRIIVIEISGLV